MKAYLLLTILTVFVLCGCVRGLTGDAGAPGVDGGSCSVEAVLPNTGAPNGGALITCPSSQSLVLNGINGQDGVAGSPGTVVTPVQFCPGTPVYPSTFIENGFCIEGQLYAVYSANGGFMVLLTPGEYSSNGINASCSFTVGANCAVSN